ncbi:MAG: basic secretory protein-like protein [Planctomycetota bacterium]
MSRYLPLLTLLALNSVAIEATIESTLTTAAPQIRMFAFDADPNSYYASSNNAGPNDHVTLVFDAPVALNAISVVTGRVKGGDALDKGVLEISTDGKTFETLAPFADGAVKADAKGRSILAVRITPSEDLKHPLAIREFTLDSTPPVTPFKYPVEVIVDVADAPEMKEWADKSARINERAYQMMCDELKSDGFTPRTVVPMAIKNDYKGVAVTYNSSRIVGATKYFKEHPADFGAMVHEMVHVVQTYKGRNNPGWLVEGLADYIRNYRWEPKKPRKLTPEQAKYDGSYQITARFLAFVMDTYDTKTVSVLNKAMREGKYSEEIFKDLTKKTLPELGEEWKASLKK